MVVAAFVVSIVAVVVSVGSVWYARSMHLTDADRRHGELTPVLKGRYIAEYHNPKTKYRGPAVAFTNEGPGHLNRVEFNYVYPETGSPIEGFAGSPTDRSPVVHRARASFEMFMGGTVTEPIVPWFTEDGRIKAGTATFLCKCYARGRKRRWDVLVDIDIPADGRLIV